MTGQHRILEALSDRAFFKLIVGGSFTDPARVAALCHLYAMARADCIDVSAELSVVEAVEAAYADLPDEVSRPLLMVSLPLDADPHFRKIDVDEPACTACDACVPACPTEALRLDGNRLLIDQPLCYGCGRCVPLCPTEALTLHPLHLSEQLAPVLSHPLVGAVEIHTRHADPYMLAPFLAQYGDLLRDKLIAVCFRPTKIPTERWCEFLRQIAEFSPQPVILQVDGQPMSGTEALEASRPALEASILAKEAMARHGLSESVPYITVSGGINTHTAELLSQPRYDFIAGAGMGTMARKAVWPWLERGEATGKAVALQIVQLFKNRQKSGIMLTGSCQ